MIEIGLQMIGFFIIVIYAMVVICDLNFTEVAIKIKNNVRVHQSDYKPTEYHSNNFLEYFIQSYKNNLYENYTMNENIFIYSMTIGINRFGNVYGHYIEAKSCAEDIGAHFIGIWKNPPEKHFHLLPSIIYHKNPSSREESLEKIKYCARLFPWERQHASWINHLSEIHGDITIILNSYIKAIYPIHSDIHIHDRSHSHSHSHIDLHNSKGGNDDNSNYGRNIYDIQIPVNIFQETNILYKQSNEVIIHRKYDIITFLGNEELKKKIFYSPVSMQLPESNMTLPLIPDAVISLRCHDILHMFMEAEYGFLNFNIYLLIIPKVTKTIYIMTESLGYNPNPMGNIEACKNIVVSLVLFLSMHYPNTTVAVLRNHPFESLIIRKEAKVCICIPSTFCLWPALANKNNVYYTITTLLAHGRAIYLGDNFHWLSYPRVYQFRYRSENDKDGSGLLKVLYTLLEVPEPPGSFDQIQKIVPPFL